MGWFDEQIKQRKRLDDDAFSDSFASIAGAIVGEKVNNLFSDSSRINEGAIEEILKFYNAKSRDIPENIKDPNEKLEYVLRPCGIMKRTIELEPNWYKNAIGAMLGVKKENKTIVALIPTGLSGYSYFDNGEYIKINKHNADLFEKEAITFYKPFPIKEIKIVDVIKYMISTITVADIMLYAVSLLIVTVIGLLVPKLNNIMFSYVIDSKNTQLLLSTCSFMICIVVSRMLFTSISNLFQTRICTKLNISVQAATMMRVLSMPANFFRNYSAGNLFSRVTSMEALCTTIMNAVLTTGLTSVFSLLYITQIFRYAKSLVWPSIIIVVLTTVIGLIATVFRINATRKRMNLSADESGMSYSVISGIQKIKLAGAEKRVFARWGRLYSKSAKLTYNPRTFVKINGTITTAISLAGTIVMYALAIKNGVKIAEYAAFNVAFGTMSVAIAGLISIASTIASIKPILEMVEPLLKEVPEISDNKTVVSVLNGGIEINDISFRYEEKSQNIIDDLSLKIRPGEYLAIVGETGCGKSTLIRLLLGFEKPQSGAIYYDGKDIESLDLKSLRRKIGTVMQDGKLFQGDVFSNIIIAAPWLTLDDAWAAAEMASIADDIRNMPMGMNTLISEGSGGISGGQRQRIMIARAVAPKPKILIFDEATSALDNITQKKVSEALDKLKCTRIVVAHRLSTIKNCNRIICLDKGKIVEDGTYDELIKKGGFFAQLVEKQRVDKS